LFESALEHGNGFSQCFLVFVSSMAGFWKRRNFSPKLIEPIKPRTSIHICPRLFTDCWNLQENLDSDLFWDGDGRFWEGFPPFCILAPRIQTCHFFIVPKSCIFWGASFELIKNLATLDPEKLQDFHGTPLYHCYTLLIGCGIIRVKVLRQEMCRKSVSRIVRRVEV